MLFIQILHNVSLLVQGAALDGLLFTKVFIDGFS